MRYTSASRALRKRTCVRPDEPLALRTSFGIGGRADWLARPPSRAELRDVMQAAVDSELTVRILGGGSNLLIVSFLSIMCVVSGVVLGIVPVLTSALFSA